MIGYRLATGLLLEQMDAIFIGEHSILFHMESRQINQLGIQGFVYFVFKARMSTVSSTFCNLMVWTQFKSVNVERRTIWKSQKILLHECLNLMIHQPCPEWSKVVNNCFCFVLAQLKSETVLGDTYCFKQTIKLLFSKKFSQPVVYGRKFGKKDIKIVEPWTYIHSSQGSGISASSIFSMVQQVCISDKI